MFGCYSSSKRSANRASRRDPCSTTLTEKSREGFERLVENSNKQVSSRPYCADHAAAHMALHSTWRAGASRACFRDTTCSFVSCNSAHYFGSNVFEAINDLGRTTMKSSGLHGPRLFFLSRTQTGKLLFGIQLHHLLRHIASGPGDGVVPSAPLQTLVLAMTHASSWSLFITKFGAVLNQGLGTRCHATVIMLMRLISLSK